MKIITLILGIFLLNTPELPREKEQLLDDWERAKFYTMDYLAAMPAEHYGFKPTPEVKSFAQQYLHIATVNYRYISQGWGIEHPYPDEKLEETPELQTKVQVIDITMKSYDMVIEKIKESSEEDLKIMSKLYNRFDLTRGQILLKAFEHQTHHRGQTTLYLRLKGVKPPFERLF